MNRITPVAPSGLLLLFFVCFTSCPSKGDFGDVAFATYQSGGTRIVFTTDTKAVVTWRNMSGDAVNGSWTKKGNEIEISWDPAAKNHGSASEKLRQTGPCSMTRYSRVDLKGEVVEGSPMVYERTQPRCDTIRVTN